MKAGAKPTVLITNDDGIDSPLLSVVVNALSASCEIRVVAPAAEQSWIGKAISRRATLKVEVTEVMGHPAWAVHGTPADCVNLALGNLFDAEQIDGVVSGINIGYNASLATVLSSGTVGAALEAALMGKPAVALSKSLPKEWFEAIQMDRSEIPEALSCSLFTDGARIAGFLDAAMQEHRHHPERVVVHNYNFPPDSSEATAVQRSFVALTRAAGLFQAVGGVANVFEFRYQLGENMDSRMKTDLNCLKEGHISYAPIDFTRLTRFE
ncbi:MAG: 5'/3'-nucleotidase SurE [Puniceicoccaceae bacterium]